MGCNIVLHSLLYMIYMIILFLITGNFYVICLICRIGVILFETECTIQQNILEYSILWLAGQAVHSVLANYINDIHWYEMIEMVFLFAKWKMTIGWSLILVLNHLKMHLVIHTGDQIFFLIISPENRVYNVIILLSDVQACHLLNQ